MERYLDRVEILVGSEKLTKLQQARVCVIGLGGVGGYAVESLARSGVGELIIVDKDVVMPSNLNRQVIATKDTLNMSKTQAAKARINAISDTKVVAIDAFVDDKFEIPDCDYVIDCIDTLTSKFYLQKQAYQKKIPCISSLGMANRFDPSKISYTTLEKTSYDPLARAFRQLVRKEHYHHRIRVVYSSEKPVIATLANEAGRTNKEKYPLGSLIFVPAAAGLLLASVVIKELLDKE